MTTSRTEYLVVIGICVAIGVIGCGKPKDVTYYSQRLDEAKAKGAECDKKRLESLKDPECNAASQARMAEIERRMREEGNRAAQRLRDRPMPTFGFGPAPDEKTK